MIDFIFQIQKKTRSGWKPLYLPRASIPLEFTNLDDARSKYELISSNYDNIRIVKIETYLIISNY